MRGVEAADDTEERTVDENEDIRFPGELSSACLDVFV